MLVIPSARWNLYHAAASSSLVCKAALLRSHPSSCQRRGRALFSSTKPTFFLLPLLSPSLASPSGVPVQSPRHLLLQGQAMSISVCPRPGAELRLCWGSPPAGPTPRSRSWLLGTTCFASSWRRSRQRTGTPGLLHAWHWTQKAAALPLRTQRAQGQDLFWPPRRRWGCSRPRGWGRTCAALKSVLCPGLVRLEPALLPARGGGRGRRHGCVALTDTAVRAAEGPARVQP